MCDLLILMQCMDNKELKNTMKKNLLKKNVDLSRKFLKIFVLHACAVLRKLFVSFVKQMRVILAVFHSFFASFSV